MTPEEKKIVDQAFDDARTEVERAFKEIGIETQKYMDKSFRIGWWGGYAQGVLSVLILICVYCAVSGLMS